MNAIVTRGLSKRYGSRIGVQDVDLVVPAGARFGFLGPNGAGKTTLIRLLLGFMRPSAGSAMVFDLDCWRASDRIKRGVGYLPGDLRLYPWLNGRSALRMASALRGMDLARAGAELAERFDLDQRVRVREMSRGMRQKLGLVLAMAHRPRLLVLDEPASGLDPIMQEVLAGMLRDHAARGNTVFFSSHSLREVEQTCDRVAIVREGRIVVHEPLETLRQRCPREVTIEFAAPAESLVPPPFLRVIERRETRWIGQLSGDAAPLLERLRGRAIRDLIIAPPDLEVIFREHYANAKPEGARS
jgi:ABC-2 type transport system ATP-binding protein